MQKQSEQGASMSDRELLGYAAKAAGLQVRGWIGNDCIYYDPITNHTGHGDWIPLEDDGDALRLAVKLGINITNSAHSPIGIPFVYAQKLHYPPCQEYGDDEYAATRRAIVRAAAAIGKEQP